MASRKSKKRMTMTSALRSAIAESGLSFLELERQTGIKRQSLMKFAQEETSLRLDKADALAEYFGLELGKRRTQ